MPQFAGTVTIGAADCAPVSVREERSIYEKNVCLDGKSRSSIQNQPPR
jgi:hypothetical protein